MVPAVRAASGSRTANSLPRLRHEHLEDPIEHLRRDADPVVGDAHHRGIPLGRQGQLHRRPGGGILDRIDQQVAEHLLEADRVRLHGQACVRPRETDLDRLGAGGRLHRLEAAAQELVEIERDALQRHLPGGDAGDVQQIVDQAGEVPCLAIDDAAVLGARPGGRAVEDLDRQHDGAERVAQLVSEHGEELIAQADGLLGLVLAAARP